MPVQFFGGEFIADDIFAPADTTDFTTFLEPLAGTEADAFLVTWAGGGFVPLLQAAIDLGVVDDDTVLGSPFVDNVVMPIFFGNAVGTTSAILYQYGAPDNAANDYLIANQAAVGGTRSRPVRCRRHERGDHGHRGAEGHRWGG